AADTARGPCSLAFAARGIKHFTFAATAGTGTGGGKLAKGCVLHVAHLTGSLAIRAVADWCTRLSVVAMTVVADYGARHFHRGLQAEGRFLIADGQIIVNVCTPAGPLGGSAPE